MVNISQALKTENCIVCGKRATYWHGYVNGCYKAALGNMVDKKIIAGFCNEHIFDEISNENGYYGDYNSEKMGKCIPLFDKKGSE